MRLGLWGLGNTAFPDFGTFLAAISSRGVAALELVAMDLKAQGVYVARTLSFAGALLPLMRLHLRVQSHGMSGRGCRAALAAGVCLTDSCVVRAQCSLLAAVSQLLRLC